MKRLTPIERMVDEATGFTGQDQRIPSTCVRCKITKRVKLTDIDPVGTMRCDLICSRCLKPGEETQAWWYDKDGKELFP